MRTIMKTRITTWLCCLCCAFSFSQSITELEYFYNSDPGFGNGTSVTPNANSGNLTQSITITAPTDAAGFNTLYVRAKDDANTWSLYSNAIFYILDNEISTIATEITAAEYFINTDPGFGNGNTIIVNANTGTLTENLAIPIGSNLNGFNSLYIRTQDNLGHWSLYDTVKFYVIDELGTGASNIAAMEYFIDTDPGFGNANSIAVNSNTGSVNQNISIPLGTLDVGFHELYIRTQDDLGEWSLYDKRTFFVTPEQAVSPIVSAEYFYDTDPGFGNGTTVALTPTGNTDEFTIDLSTTEISCDFHDFYIRLINEDGSWSLYDYGLQIEVFDNADPTIVVLEDITVALDVSGNGSITIADVDNGTFDDCELVSVVLNQTQFNYTCANLGANTVTITATDAEDKVSTEDVTITVVDNINPVAITQNITVQLDENGDATITPAQINNGSTDNCGVTGFSLDTTNFNCSNLGTNTVNLTVTDSSGNSNTASATVTVVDEANPTVVTQAITVNLNANGEAIISADAIDNGSTDNCTIVSRILDISAFTCDDLGENTVTLTVTDQNGNSETGTAIVTVQDTINPTVVTQNITVQLDASGSATIMASQIENGSTDNCGIVNSSLDISTFSCDDLGANTVTLSVTDQSGNTGTDTASVTILDDINPVAQARDITVELDLTGNATITANDVDNNSTDNCNIASMDIDIDSFTCADIGANTVVLTVEDASGNLNTASAVVTVEDNLNPVAVGQDLTLDLSGNPSISITASQIDNGSLDNCSSPTLSINVDTFTAVGTYPVVLTATDAVGNENTTTVTVTVTDSTLGISDNDFSASAIKLYPVPVTNYLNILSPLAIDVLTVYDVTGKVIMEFKQPHNKINLQSLTSGVYFLRFEAKNSKAIKRIIKK
ncbi:putative secreted protein (Por secretion system target) [Jejuia pallidilutea]|uniref:Putative secreted protein (Por secretion system target) n=2 Tax=Jejuia pallidilutea TaxID=504487 RepID=A0A362WZ65_9FLAO|nr:putative secreted protein (Por secretion system target) [Jejuia pallidilutea]